MNEKKREIRICPQGCSVRSVTNEDGTKHDSRTIEGYAITFNRESQLLDDWGESFVEVIAPSCCTESYIRECDIKMTLFHNRESLLARSNKGEGSLTLSVDEQGVRFSFEAPNTMLGDMALEGVKRGDLSGCSFTFVPKDYTVTERNGVKVITHESFAWLGEMTIGSDPAYLSTSVNVRELGGKSVEPKVDKGAELAREIRMRYLSRTNY